MRCAGCYRLTYMPFLAAAIGSILTSGKWSIPGYMRMGGPILRLLILSEQYKLC
jgi:hypothetical protein